MWKDPQWLTKENQQTCFPEAILVTPEQAKWHYIADLPTEKFLLYLVIMNNKQLCLYLKPVWRSACGIYPTLSLWLSFAGLEKRKKNQKNETTPTFVKVCGSNHW